MNGTQRPLNLAIALTLASLLIVLLLGLWRAVSGPPTFPIASASSASASAIAKGVPPPLPPAAFGRILPQGDPPPWTAEPPATPTPALAPSPTPSATLSPSPTPAPSARPASLALTGIRHEWQTWNNCGPATLAMALSYHGSTLDQGAVGAVLRRHPDDKNVGPHELAQYARAQGFQAQVRVGGDADLLKTLLNNGLPILLETWHAGEDGSLYNGLGHYRLLAGYDDAAQAWIAYDSYDAANLVNPAGPYAGIRLPYAETDTLWSVFNRTYVLVYPQEQAEKVEALVGSPGDGPAMWQRSLDNARAATAARPDDAFSWFNLGSSAVSLGDYATAAAAFDQARTIGLPWRMLWYQFGPFEAYYHTGRFDEVVALASATLASTETETVEELHYWRGMALAGLGRVEEAQLSWNRALELNPTYSAAADALAEYARQ